MEICLKNSCEVFKCSLRHPKTCRYHRDIGYCKFGEWCAFKHEHSENKAMEEVYDSRIETIENNLDQLQKDLSEKDTLIVTLEEKLMYLEEKLKLYEDKTKELSEKIIICENNDKVKGLEEIQINLVEEAEKYRCNKCDFKTYYKRGLNIHKRKMHKVYPCANCEDIFDTIRDAKVHSYTHYYTETDDDENKCNNCDFQVKCLNTIEVHVGWCRQSNFECGLCGNNFEEKEDLETHLRSCEMYECGRYSCWLRVKSLSDMKKHIEEKHTTSTSLHHLKIDREKEFSVTSKFYYVKDL